MAAGEARGLTPVGPPPAALAAPSRADVSLMVAESTVFWRRKKLVGAPPDEMWLPDVGVAAVEAREPAEDGLTPAVVVVPLAAAAADVAVAPEALAFVAASRVSPPDDARRPPGLDEVAEMDRWTLRCPDALVEPVVDPVDACDEWPDEGTREVGPDATADSVRGGTPRSDKELPDRDPSLSS